MKKNILLFLMMLLLATLLFAQASDNPGLHLIRILEVIICPMHD